MANPQNEKIIDRIVDNCLAQLMEHGCDAVRIVASVQDGRLTYRKSKGAGNYYAQVGLAKEFVDRDQATTTDQVFHENED